MISVIFVSLMGSGDVLFASSTPSHTDDLISTAASSHKETRGNELKK